MNNPIIDEIREARAALAEEHGYDLVRLNKWAQAQTDARKRQAAQPLVNEASVPTTEASLSAERSETRNQ